MHREVLGGDRLDAHPAGHPQTLEDPAGGGAATDRARLAVVAVGAVGGADPVEAVPLHDTRETLALAGAGDVDLLAGGEDVGTELLAEGVVGGVGRTDLDDMAAR